MGYGLSSQSKELSASKPCFVPTATMMSPASKPSWGAGEGTTSDPRSIATMDDLVRVRALVSPRVLPRKGGVGWQNNLLGEKARGFIPQVRKLTQHQGCAKNFGKSDSFVVAEVD